MIRQHVIPKIRNYEKNAGVSVMFQQDGASSHTAHTTLDFFGKENFFKDGQQNPSTWVQWKMCGALRKQSSRNCHPSRWTSWKTDWEICGTNYALFSCAKPSIGASETGWRSVSPTKVPESAIDLSDFVIFLCFHCVFLWFFLVIRIIFVFI